MKTIYHPAILVSIILLSCSNPTGLPTGVSNKTPFIADPQPVTEQNVETLSIDAIAPDFYLPATDGNYYSLSDFRDAQVLVIVFTCNHCPTAQAYEDRLIQAVKDYKDKGVEFVAISPNSPLGLLYEELGYSDLNDDFEEMKIRAKDKNFNFPYLYDGDTQEASLKYGPVATPQVYVFNQNRELVYRGRFDAIEKPGNANAEDLRSALDALLSGAKPKIRETKIFGCSTKWGWKLDWKEKINKEWNQKAVQLTKINKTGIQNLVKNKESGKLRLINVWATWCGPCIIEYPEFIEIQRMYGARDFEFVSISADNPIKEEMALKFLEEKHSAITNYLFNNTDKYALIEAVDPDWNGALPYTMLIEPGGQVVWKHQGEVDFYALKKAIVEHPLLGRYY